MDDRNEEILETPGDDANSEGGESAEDQVVRLGEALAQARSEVTEIQAHHVAMERERAIDAALVEQGAVDLETARMVVQSCLEKDEEKTVVEVVVELQERKPFLFQPPAPPVSASGVMSAQGGGAGGVVKRAEKEARESGHRRDVLRFMRLRRGRK